MAYDYEIQYKQGKSNQAAEALSRMNSFEVILHAIDATSPELYSKVQES